MEIYRTELENKSNRLTQTQASLRVKSSQTHRYTETMPTTHRPTQTYTNNPQTNRHYANNLHKHIPTTHRHTETMPTTHRPTETYTNNPQTNRNYANNPQTNRNYANNPQTYRNIYQQPKDLQKHMPTWVSSRVRSRLTHKHNTGWQLHPQPFHTYISQFQIQTCSPTLLEASLSYSILFCTQSYHTMSHNLHIHTICTKASAFELYLTQT